MAKRDASTSDAILLETGQTATPSGVFFGFTVGVSTARKSLARVDASALNASQLTIAILIGLALGTGLSAASSLSVGVS